MSADFVIYTCAHPSNLGLDHDQARSRLKEYALSVDREELNAFFEESGQSETLEEAYLEEVGAGPLEHLGDMLDADASIEPDLQWGREQLCSKLLSAYDQTFEDTGSREIAELSLGGLTFLVSGGMSWGDDPTEAGPLLRRLDWTGVFDIESHGLNLKGGVLNLSTSHIPHRKVLKDVKDLGVYWGCQSHDTGWIVFVGDQPSADSNAADWFRPVLKLARAMGCQLVNFDMDGPETKLLPTYTEPQ